MGYETIHHIRHKLCENIYVDIFECGRQFDPRRWFLHTPIAEDAMSTDEQVVNRQQEL